MGEQYEVGLQLKTGSDTASLAQTNALLVEIRDKLSHVTEAHNKASGAARQHAESAGLLGQAYDELASKITGMLGLAAIEEFLRRGAAEAMDQEVALRALSATVGRLGGDGEVAARKTKELAEQLDRFGIKGLTEEGVIAGVEQLTIKTGSYEEALGGAELAARVAAGTHKEYGEVLMIVSLLAGDSPRGATMAHRMFGMQIGKTNAEILKNLDSLGTYNVVLGTNAQAIADDKHQLSEFGKEIGGPLASALVWLIERFKDIGHFAAAVALAIKHVAETVVTFISDIVGNFNVKHPFESLKVGMAAWREDSAKLLEQSTAEWEAWADSVEKAKAKTEAPEKGGGGKPITPHGGEDGDDKETARKNLLDRIQERARILATAYKDEQKQRDEQARQALESQRREDAQALKLYQDYQKRRQDEERKAYQLSQVNWKKMNLDELKDLREKLAEARGALIQYGDDTAAIDKQIIAIDKMTQQQKVESAIGATTEVLGMASQAFGKSKELAVAHTLMSTYQSAEEAYKAMVGIPYVGPVLAVIAAAAAVAFGMQQVKAITSTSPGGGGGASGGASGGGFSVSGGQVMVPSSSLPGSTMVPQSVTTANHYNGGDTYVIQSLTPAQSALAARDVQKVLASGQRSYDRQLPQGAARVVGSRRA